MGTYSHTCGNRVILAIVYCSDECGEQMNYLVYLAQGFDITMVHGNGLIDPNKYDDCDSHMDHISSSPPRVERKYLADVPRGMWTAQPIYEFSCGIRRAQYGQKLYETKESAIRGCSSDPFVYDLLAKEGHTNWLIVLQGADDLSDPAQFVRVPK